MNEGETKNLSPYLFLAEVERVLLRLARAAGVFLQERGVRTRRVYDTNRDVEDKQGQDVSEGLHIGENNRLSAGVFFVKNNPVTEC